MTDLNDGGLRRVAARSLGWSWAATATSIAMQVVYAAAIARLVEPAAFGALAAGLLALRFVAYIAKLGVSQAVIQRTHFDGADANSAHLVSVVGGILGFLVTLLLAPSIGRLIGAPDAATATRWLALGLVLNGFAAVPEAILRRRLEFRVLALAQIASYFLSNLVVAVALAFVGLDLPALLGAYLGGWLLDVLFLTWACRPRPRLFGDRSSVVPFLTFGGLVSVTSVLDVIGSSTDALLVGRLGASSLGQYSRGSTLVGLPIQQASSAANRVAGPGLSRLQSDSKKFGDALTAALGLTAVSSAIAGAVAAAAAPALVSVMLGPQWPLAAAILPPVAAAQVLWLITQVIVTAAEAKGAVRPRFCIQLVATVVNIGVIGLMYLHFGTAVAIGVGWMIGEGARLVLHSVIAVRHLDVRPEALVRRLTASLVAATLVSTPAYLIVRVWRIDGVGGLFLAALGAFAIVGTLWFGFPRSLPRADLRQLGLSRLRNAPVSGKVGR